MKKKKPFPLNKPLHSHEAAQTGLRKYDYAYKRFVFSPSPVNFLTSIPCCQMSCKLYVGILHYEINAYVFI